MTPQRKVAWVGICCTFLGAVEGLRTIPYLDVGGIPTDCIGETQGVKLSDRPTVEQCEAKVAERIQVDYGPQVDQCINHPLPANRKAAYVSVAYNAGPRAFCGSAIARYENLGFPDQACNAIVGFRETAAGKYSPGLHNRRLKEKALCLQPSA